MRSSDIDSRFDNLFDSLCDDYAQLKTEHLFASFDVNNI